MRPLYHQTGRLWWSFDAPSARDGILIRGGLPGELAGSESSTHIPKSGFSERGVRDGDGRVQCTLDGRLLEAGDV